jgi:hypothetical protein
MGTKAVQIESLWNGITDSSGNMLSGGKVYTYEAGTTIPKALYTAPDKSVEASNPVILDAEGKALVYGDGSYKFVIKDATGNDVRTLNGLSYFLDNFPDGTYVDARAYGDGSLTSSTINAAIVAIGTVNKRILLLVP